MKNINLFIKDNVKDIGKDVYVTPEIPEKKLNNAIKAFKCESFYESILAIQDGTIFGSSKEGFVFTGEKMIHHEHGEFIYSEIESVDYIKDVKIDDKGKEKIKEYVLISKNGKKSKFEYLLGINEEKLASFLNTIITEFEDYKEENQLTPLAEMSDELKVAYIKFIVNMTFIDDLEIDEKELAEILLLMTRIEIKKDSRFDIRAYITNISNDNIIAFEDLIEDIKNNSEASQYELIMTSLVKDLTNTYLSSRYSKYYELNKDVSKIIDDCLKDFTFIEEHGKLFNLSDKKIELTILAIKTDYEMLKKNLDDGTIKKNLKELSAKAAAAGTPLAAVYISGSVMGMSAAGITSGLATLGMGMGMTGGLAIIGIIGVVSYKGMKQLTGANELDKYKTRELMLHKAIRETQKTISLIIDDVNYIVQKLNDTILKHSEQKEKIKKLTQMVAQFQGALKSVDTKSNLYQNSANRLHSPKILDDARFKALTEEATKKPLYDFVIANYELKIIEDNNVKELVLKENVTTETLDKMAEIFKALGYFDMDNILKSKASGFVKGILG